MRYDNIIEYVDSREFTMNNIHPISESADDPKPFRDKHLEIRLPDVEDFVKKNDVKEITNPVFFVKTGIPTSDGLLSNEIFGITKEERANIWGYINLRGNYLHPLIYKIWGKMDSSIKNIVYGLKGYVIDKDGYIVEDLENGETGLDFLYKNIDRIKIRRTNAKSRDRNIEFIMKHKDRMFIKKMLVQPPYYRDVLNNKGRVEVGQLNKYYSSLLIFARSLKETQDMGFSIGNSTKGRIQELLLSIYKCVTGTGNPEDGVGLSGKLGIIHGTALSKTVDYGTRLVMSAQELKVERLEDIMVDTEHCAIPLSSAIVNFKPFIVFQIKRFFENEFGGRNICNVFDNGKMITARVKDPEILFSDENIEKQIKRFVYSFSKRLEPVEVPVILDNGKEAIKHMYFLGRSVTHNQIVKGEVTGESPLINRPLTWCDVLYMAATEAVRDKCVLVTRHPIDSAYNQIPFKVRISTIKYTEYVHVYGNFYRWYPKIRKEDIGRNTANMFIDTLNVSNLMIGSMGADFDGDQASIKGVYLQESNRELMNFIKSKSHYIGFSGSNMRSCSKEAIQSLYCMTRVLDQDVSKLTSPIF